MELEVFKKKVKILDKEEGDAIREKYIDTFVNRLSPHYKKYVEMIQKFKDGYCYTGYLWDCLKEPALTKEEYVESKAKEINDVYVFWDIHSCERIFIKDYWKFDKDTVLKLKFSDLIEGQNNLPEDVYIFDDSFAWTLILTHEDIYGERYYLRMVKGEDLPPRMMYWYFSVSSFGFLTKLPFSRNFTRTVSSALPHIPRVLRCRDG